MDRRNFLKSICAAAAGAVFSPSSVRAAKSRRPNVILIMADDLGYECLSSNGGSPYKTPVLDRLAAEGIRFTNCCAQPLCTPSRAKIMTGRYNFRNYLIFGILKHDETTFGHVMKKAGYRTCIAGKWQLGRDRKLVSHFGFDEYCLWWLENRGERYTNADKLMQNGKLLPKKAGQYGPDVVSNFMLDFITRNKDEQFFCYYPMILTHAPFVPTPDSADPDCKDISKNFEDMVAYTDKIVAKIVSHLKKLELLDNTVILFVGDNGTGREIVSKLNGKDYSGAKGQMTSDAGPHVPFVAYWPAGGVKGAVFDDPIDFSDFLPTIADLGEAQLPEGVTIDGASFAGRLRGDRNYKPRDYSYICYYGQKRRKPTVCARGRRYHLLGDGNMYDFIEDPLFANPIPAEKAKAERAMLQSVIDRMEIERAKSDELIAKGRYMETIDPALTRDGGNNNRRNNQRIRRRSKKQSR